ncbi:MAG: cation transporter [Dysgonamonadaceae bacterium]|jgi:Cu(I)/Ag(I) efflux system membrane fusion protein|nr:cation transporter [Dysgonamonadaceae bacterium]
MKKLVFIGAIAVCLTVAYACNKSKTETPAATTEAVNTETATLGVKGNCEMCKQRIETAAQQVEGVNSASWNEENKSLEVNFDPSKTSIDAVSAAVAQAGYDTDLNEADAAAYSALPPCCQYR